MIAYAVVCAALVAYCLVVYTLLVVTGPYRCQRHHCFPPIVNYPGDVYRCALCGRLWTRRGARWRRVRCYPLAVLRRRYFPERSSR